VPFKANRLMLFISLLVAGLSVFFGLMVYKTENSDAPYHRARKIPSALGGWLIVLMIVLFGSSIGMIKNLIDGGFYSLSKWNEVLTGAAGIVNRAMLIYKASGYVALICFSVFCLVLVYKKRDISPMAIKAYYLSMVLFLAVYYILDAFINGKFKADAIEELLNPLVVAIIWTYYLKTSERVKRTFVVRYPD
jgi:hypothetical protein